MSVDISAILESAEGHLKAEPPNAAQAINELAPLIKGDSPDPRAFLLQAIALALSNQRSDAKEFAEYARVLGLGIVVEADALIERLK